MSGLSWAPVDSTDARELRELGQLLQERPEQPGSAARPPLQIHDDRCRSGWLGEDDAGRPVPCLTCRPHLASVPCRSCQTVPLVCSAHAGITATPCCERCDHQPTPKEVG